MSKAAAGYKYWKHEAWEKLISSIPPSYVIWRDASTAPATYRAECNIVGGNDLNDTDTGVVAQACADVLGMTGGRIHFRGNTNYEWASGVTLAYNAHQDIRFTGEGVSTMFTTTDDDLKFFTGAGIGIAMDSQQLKYIGWSDLCMVGTGVLGGAGRGIDLTWGHYFDITRCRLTNFSDSAVYWNNVDNAYLTNSWIDDTRGSCLETATNCGENTIAGNQFEESMAYGLELNFAYGNAIVGNLISGCDESGVFFNGGGPNQFTGNMVTGNTKHGIVIIGGYGHQIVGNQIEENDCANTNTYDGINIYNSPGTIITGNRITENDRDGIRLTNDVDNTQIANNYLALQGNGYDINVAHAGAVGTRIGENVLKSTNTVYNAGTGTLTSVMPPLRHTVLDLSGGATDVLLYHASAAAVLVGYVVLYTEASSADVDWPVDAIRIGRYQDGVALDDDYFDETVSEASKNIGYSKEFLSASLTQTTIAAGDSVTVGTGGGKTGAGEVTVILKIVNT